MKKKGLWLNEENCPREFVFYSRSTLESYTGARTMTIRVWIIVLLPGKSLTYSCLSPYILSLCFFLFIFHLLLIYIIVVWFMNLSQPPSIHIRIRYGVPK